MIDARGHALDAAAAQFRAERPTAPVSALARGYKRDMQRYAELTVMTVAVLLTLAGAAVAGFLLF